MKKSLWHSKGKQDMEPKSKAKVMKNFYFFYYTSQVKNQKIPTSFTKIASEMEVAPRFVYIALYTAYTVHTVQTVYTIQTALHCLKRSPYAFVESQNAIGIGCGASEQTVGVEGVRLPNRMNFRKNSKQPSTPPLFRKIMLQIFYAR